MSTGSYFIEEEEKYASHCMVGIGRFLRLDVVRSGSSLFEGHAVVRTSTPGYGIKGKSVIFSDPINPGLGS